MAQVVKDVVTWLKQWFYTESEVDTITGGLQTQINNKADASTVNTLSTTVSGKADATHTHGNLQSDGSIGTSANANKNVVTDSNGKITTEAKPTIPSASSSTPLADTTSGTVGSGTTWARADHRHPKSSLYAESVHTHLVGDVVDWTDEASVEVIDFVDEYFTGFVDNLISYDSENNKLYYDGTALTDEIATIGDLSGKANTSHTHGNLQSDGQVGSTAQANKNVVTDSNGKITTEDKYTHPSTHSSTIITESSALANINTSANATQHDINTAINTAIGNLSSIEAIKVVDTKPTASADTMGKLYIISENSKVNVYYTKRTGTSSNYTYSWQKMDTDILDELSISWNDITNKPTNLLISTIDLIDAGETNAGCIIFNTIS